MTGFAKGTHAIGDCSRCGFQYPLLDLRIDGRYPAKKLLVCETCWDPWDPQEHPWPAIYDPQALAQPAPEVAGYVAFRDIVSNGIATTTGLLDLYNGGAADTTDYGFPNLLQGGPA